VPTPIPTTQLVQGRDSNTAWVAGTPINLRISLRVNPMMPFRRLYIGWNTFQAIGVRIEGRISFRDAVSADQISPIEFMWGAERFPEGIVLITQTKIANPAIPSFRVLNLTQGTEQQYPYEGASGALCVAHSWVDPAVNSNSAAPFQILMYPFPLVGEFGSVELSLRMDCQSIPPMATSAGAAAWLACASDVARA